MQGNIFVSCIFKCMTKELIKYKCPKCLNHEMISISAFYMRNHRKSVCRECNRKRLKENNPFKGKQHTKETMQRIAEKAKQRILTEEHKAKITAVLRKANFKTPLYEHWTNKYGKQVADEKLAAMKAKHSQNNSGTGNPMYGKPAPQGSGAGISGWYKNWFFRSLRELTYVLTVLEPNGDSWVCTEKKNYGIKYVFNGKTKTYFPDFLINNKKIVEIKPLRLQTTANNLAKKEAAENFCVDNNLIYEIIDIKPIQKDQLIKLINDGLVILTNKSKERAKL